MTKGGRNLLIMGVMSIVVAFATTGVSLAIYKYSGDIYLDRSRPGYLPDEEEIDAGDPEGEFEFGKTGELNRTDLEEYLEAFDVELEAIDQQEKPFDADALSDEALHI